MRTDAIAVELRPRNDWEAIDLGLELGRAWFAPLAIAWTLAYAIPAIGLVAVSPWPLATAGAAWLLRPWAERALVEVLARRSFHQPVTVGLALGAVVRAPLHPGAWLASLTWRRFSAVRTAWLAVWQLEGLRGRAARARVRILTAQGWGACAWCALLGLGATVFLALGGLAVALALLPDATGAGVRDWLDGDVPVALREVRTWSLIVVAADALCAPWVLAAQFGWYLSRRTDLEAWDIELVFRALARRVAATALLLALLAGARPAHAQTDAPAVATPVDATSATAPPASFDARKTIDAILAQPEFGRDDVVQQWRLRTGSSGPSGPPSPWLIWLLARMPAIATALRWGMWLLGAAAIAWLVRLAWRGQRRDAAATAPALAEPEFETAGALDQPDLHVVRAARDAIERGRVLDALALLYRGALRVCHTRGLIDVRPGDTEGEYLTLIAGRLSPDAERTVGDVVRAWQAAAYARRAPSPEQALSMCEAYRLHVAGEEP